MTKADHITQVRVGFFLILGLTVICALIVYFGRFGDGLKESYEIRVEYPNASGLFAGADVLLAGARIGAVDRGPFVLKDMRGVYVVLKLYEEVQIPQSSTFTIGSSGLLGDTFVDITMPQDLDVEKFVPIAPGSVVRGKRESGIADLASGGADLLADVRGAIKNIDTVVTRINTEVLNDETVKSMGETMKNLEKTSTQMAVAAEDFDGVLADARKAVSDVSASVNQVTSTTEETVRQSQETIRAATEAAESFTRAMNDIRAVIADAKTGKGPIGALLTDQTISDNLRALVYNVRRYGILFYKDRAITDRLKYEERLKEAAEED
ncbi:MAG: MlaD family protein [Chthoniobacterales bacterium]